MNFTDRHWLGAHARILSGNYAHAYSDLNDNDRAGSTEAVIHWIILDGPGGAETYEVRIANGACETSSQTSTDEPRLAITVAPVDFVKVVSGNGNPVMMFMSGKLKAKGDLGLAANIQHIFAVPKA